MSKMKNALMSAAIVAPAIALSACATNFDVDGVAAIPNKGDAFASALHKRYIDRARFEVGESDWISVDYFTTRAEMAAMGTAPAPQKPSDRALKTDGDAIMAGHKRLVAALNTSAPQVAPDACALSQTWLEHWMEQAEEGHQNDHIAWTRGEFQKIIPKCVGDVSNAAMMPVPGPFDVFFGFDSTKLDAKANAVIKGAVSAAKSYGPQTISVNGHTDRAGSVGYNARLAERRADTVLDALADAGIRAMWNMASFGETRPRVKTGDGVRNPVNRRVEIRFGKK